MPGARDFDHDRQFDSTAHEDADEELGEGEPLEGATRSRWEWVFGRDFSDVRVHTGDEADTLAARESAAAFAIGEDIGFRSGAYGPGTIEGDALLAHELAHVVQQEDAVGRGAGVERDGAVEADANAAVLGAAAPRLRTGVGLRLAACNPPKQEPPSYLGPDSRRALRDIERITSSGDQLQWFILMGTVVSTTTSAPEEDLATGSYDVSPQAQALLAIPVIVYNRVITVIELLQLEHENDMNDQEKAFWERMHDRASRAMQQATARQSAGARGGKP